MARPKKTAKNDTKTMTSEKAKAMKEAVAGKADEMKETVSEKTEEMKDTVSEKTKEVSKAAKETAELTVTSAKETAKKVKEETRKYAAKKAEKKIVLQYAGKEIGEDALMDRITAEFTAVEPEVTVKKIFVYLKPEDGAAYYVINDQYTGKVEF